MPEIAKVGRVLHAGCGDDPLPEWCAAREEVRLDVRPGARVDIVADIRYLSDDLISSFDAVVCLHCLEHVTWHEAQDVLRGFARVLRPGGVAFITVPDLDGVRCNDKVVYQSPAGPITGIDMFYGYQRQVINIPEMTHKCGFVSETLHNALAHTGFHEVSVRHMPIRQLFAVARRP